MSSDVKLIFTLSKKTKKTKHIADCFQAVVTTLAAAAVGSMCDLMRWTQNNVAHSFSLRNYHSSIVARLNEVGDGTAARPSLMVSPGSFTLN